MNLDQAILYWIHDNLSRAARSALSLRRAGKFAFSKLVFDIREKMQHLKSRMPSASARPTRRMPGISPASPI